MIIEHLTQDEELFDFPRFGRVEESITPILPGRISYSGASWSAQFACSQGREVLQPGERVVVVGRLGTTLFVISQNECRYCRKGQKPCSRECVLRLKYLHASPSR